MAPSTLPSLGTTDTIVRRTAPGNVPVVPSTTTIPIELVALSLASTQPITVTYNGGQNPEQWQVGVRVGDAPGTGLMNVTRQSMTGGIFHANVGVSPLFVFRKLTDNTSVSIQIPMALSWANVPWAFECPPGVLRVGGVTSDFCSSATSEARARSRMIGADDVHGVLPACILNDSDCDGFTDLNEAFIGTDPVRWCAVTSQPNNELQPDAWPLDFNDDQKANTIDIGFFVPVLNSMAPGPPYHVRFDFTMDGKINTIDVGKFVPALNKKCLPIIIFA